MTHTGIAHFDAARPVARDAPIRRPLMAQQMGSLPSIYHCQKDRAVRIELIGLHHSSFC